MNETTEERIEQAKQPLAPDWMSWVWEFDPENLWIKAIDPQDEDSGHIVYEFKHDPGPELVNMILDSRDVLMNIERLIDDKIQQRRHVITNVDLIQKRGYQRLHATLSAVITPYVGRKFTRKRANEFAGELFEAIDDLVEVKADHEPLEEE